MLKCVQGVWGWIHYATDGKSPSNYPFLFAFQKYEKPKFVQCLAFLGNGDVLTGDSGGIILIWGKTTVESTPGKGPKGRSHSQLIAGFS